MPEAIAIDPDNGVADPWCVSMASLTQMEGNALERMTAQERATAEDYFNGFAMPAEGCIRCGERGSFVWGLAHGHGNCFACGWPGTAYHFLDVAGKRERFVMVLWCHPIHVRRRATKAA